MATGRRLGQRNCTRSQGTRGEQHYLGSSSVVTLLRRVKRGAATGVAFSQRRNSHAETNKSSGIICPGCLLAYDGRHARRERRLQITRSHQGRRRRKALSAGLWSLPCKRRVGMDAGRKRRTQYRVLVYLLAYKTWKRMVALGHGCS